MIHASMDNSDHIENSKYGKDKSYDTFVILFDDKIFNLAIIEINICCNFIELISKTWCSIASAS